MIVKKEMEYMGNISSFSIQRWSLLLIFFWGGIALHLYDDIAYYARRPIELEGKIWISEKEKKKSRK